MLKRCFLSLVRNGSTVSSNVLARSPRWAIFLTLSRCVNCQQQFGVMLQSHPMEPLVRKAKVSHARGVLIRTCRTLQTLAPKFALLCSMLLMWQCPHLWTLSAAQLRNGRKGTKPKDTGQHCSSRTVDFAPQQMERRLTSLLPEARSVFLHVFFHLPLCFPSSDLCSTRSSPFACVKNHGLNDIFFHQHLSHLSL